ncbi:hypothetical protein KCP69_12165 [Salmonella enterica subsp. enterica]|nr:hypothetical protein KCP69_12165 [Salmonella enterica subsp. enterica]
MLVNSRGAMTKSAAIDMPFTQWRQIFTVDDGAFSARRSPPGKVIKQAVSGGRPSNITRPLINTAPLRQASAAFAAKHALGID